ncbi:MAG TPA: thioredoxin domain-containing protein [Solirubrobacterales bacterium]|nr:thioredoxin domain-containing protein [Solirubrobacterales bacterium]
MSGKRDREARREERLREGEGAAATERRQRMIKLASAIGFLALAVVAVLIVVSQSDGGGGGDAENISGAAEVNAELQGIPQKDMVLGSESAKATLVEFADLQCPFCKGFAEEILPAVIDGKVRDGEARIEYRNFTIIGPESTPAGAAAIAAGKQGRGWNFVKLFYRNQGAEGTSYVTDEFLTAIARAARVPDIARWNRDRKSKSVLDEVSKTTAEAEGLGFHGTPSFAVEGAATQGLEPLGTPSSSGDLESALEKAAG